MQYDVHLRDDCSEVAAEIKGMHAGDGKGSSANAAGACDIKQGMLRLRDHAPVAAQLGAACGTLLVGRNKLAHAVDAVQVAARGKGAADAPLHWLRAHRAVGHMQLADKLG